MRSPTEARKTLRKAAKAAGLLARSVSRSRAEKSATRIVSNYR
ncbi:hypothetical protein [Mesorhizobium sp.]|nr:hypothetical protein [Mesorhizobium sp.]